MKRKIPSFASDEEAERFVETADLTEYDLSDAAAVRFESERKDAGASSAKRSSGR